jgi:hypothetical protein
MSVSVEFWEKAWMSEVAIVLSCGKMWLRTASTPVRSLEEYEPDIGGEVR